jgi:hypothetical protein
MGIAAMVIGIVAVSFAWVPICGSIALTPAIVGLVLGIVEVALKSAQHAPKKIGAAGIVLNGVAIAFILFWWCIFIPIGLYQDKLNRDTQVETKAKSTQDANVPSDVNTLSLEQRVRI